LVFIATGTNTSELMKNSFLGAKFEPSAVISRLKKFRTEKIKPIQFYFNAVAV
jgi:hypothetical protein